MQAKSVCSKLLSCSVRRPVALSTDTQRGLGFGWLLKEMLSLLRGKKAQLPRVSRESSTWTEGRRLNSYVAQFLSEAASLVWSACWVRPVLHPHSPCTPSTLFTKRPEAMHRARRFIPNTQSENHPPASQSGCYRCRHLFTISANVC